MKLCGHTGDGPYTLSLLLSKSDATTMVALMRSIAGYRQGVDEWNPTAIWINYAADVASAFSAGGFCQHEFTPNFCGFCGSPRPK